MSASLNKVHVDLDDATSALGQVRVSDDHDSIARLTNASEALLRALASLTLAVERLAETQVEPHKYENEHQISAYLAELAAEDAAAEAAYDGMVAHPETVVDAQDLF
jgi:hypothetical protein